VHFLVINTVFILDVFSALKFHFKQCILRNVEIKEIQLELSLEFI